MSEYEEMLEYAKEGFMFTLYPKVVAENTMLNVFHFNDVQECQSVYNGSSIEEAFAAIELFKMGGEE